MTIRLFRIISSPSKLSYFRPQDHVTWMDCKALDFQCQCTQQKFQSICAVLAFDRELSIFYERKISIKLFYLYQNFNAETIASLKLNCFLSLFAAVSIMKGKRSAFIYFWYQTDRGVPNTSIYPAVSLASPYYNYLKSTASTTIICWRCHSNSINTGSRLAYLSDVKTRKRRNVVGIDMIRNNRIRNFQ
jgi:hypothetical protein